MEREIPEYEMGLYRYTVEEAIGLAMLDRVPAGRQSLEHGLKRVEAMARAGDPCAGPLAARYRAAIERYVRRYTGRPPAD